MRTHLLNETRVSDLLYRKAQQVSQGGGKMWLTTADVSGNDCHNCGGASIVLSWLSAGGSESVPTVKPGSESVTFHNDKWHKMSSRGYPCPVCSNPVMSL